MYNLFRGETMSREIICPLMEERKESGEYRFKEELRFCDCPRLREFLLATKSSKICTDGKSCFVRDILVGHE